MIICEFQHLSLNKFLAALLPIASIFVFVYLFRTIKNATIRERIKLTPRILFLRAFLAGFIILAIIATAKLVGSRWAGLLSAFPSTLFPLILIVHLTYDKTHVFPTPPFPAKNMILTLVLLSRYFVTPRHSREGGSPGSFIFFWIPATGSSPEQAPRQ